MGTQSSCPSPCAGPRIKNNAYLFIYEDKRRLKSDVDSLHSKLRHKSNIRNPFLRRQRGQNAGLATSADAFDDHSDKQLDLFTGVFQLNTLANFVNSQMIFLLPHCPKQTLFIAPPPPPPPRKFQFNFSWVLQASPEKSKTMVMENF